MALATLLNPKNLAVNCQLMNNPNPLSPQAQELVDFIIDNQKINGQKIRLGLMISQAEYIKSINEAIDAGYVTPVENCKYYRVLPKNI